MTLILLFTALLISPACAVPAHKQEDGEKESLRKEVIRLSRELLELKRRIAREAGNEDEEYRLLAEEGLGSPYEEIRIHTLILLRDLPEERRRKAVPTLLSALPGMSSRLRSAVVEFFGPIDTPGAREAVLAAADDEAPEVRKSAADALKRLQAPDAINALHRLVYDSHPDVQHAALDGLGTLRSHSSVPILISFCRTVRDPRLREKAIRSLGDIGDTAAVSPLLGILEKETDEGVQYAAINSIGKLGVFNEEVKKAINPYLEGDHPVHIREITIRALGKLRDPNLLPRFREHMISDQPRLRAAAFQAIALLAGDADPLLEQDLLPILRKETDAEAQNTMWNALTLFADEDFVRLTRIARGLTIEAALLPRLEEILGRLAQLDPGTEENRLNTYAALKEKAASVHEAEGHFREALQHYRQLCTLFPEKTDPIRNVARCEHRLKESENALRLLSETITKLGREHDDWWALKTDYFSILFDCGKHLPLIRESHPLISQEGVPRSIVDLHERSARALIATLQDRERAAGAESDLLELSRAVILPLANVLEDEDFLDIHPTVFSIGSRITGAPPETLPPPPDSPEARQKTAEAWRAWLKPAPP